MAVTKIKYERIRIAQFTKNDRSATNKCIILMVTISNKLLITCWEIQNESEYVYEIDSVARAREK